MNGLCLNPGNCKYFEANPMEPKACAHCVYGDCFNPYLERAGLPMPI